MAAISRIDALAHNNGWSSRHLADKAVLAGGLILAATALPAIPAAPVVLVACIAIALVGAHVSLRDYLGVVKVPMAFVAIGALTTALDVRFRGGFAVGFGGWQQAWPLAMRGLAGAAALGLFVVLVPIPELLGQLRRAGLATSVVEIALLMYRLIAVTVNESRSSHRAQVQRGGYDGFTRSMRSASLLIAGSAARTIRRSERVSIGLAARGFEGDLPMLTSGARRSRRFEAGTIGLLVGLVAVSVAWKLGR